MDRDPSHVVHGGRIMVMNKERIRKALELVLTDLQMLKSGEWSPDKDSVQASIDNVELIASELELEWSRLASQKIMGDPKKLAEYIIDYVHEEWVRRYPDEFYTTPKQELGDLYEAYIEQAIEAYEGGAR